MYRNLERYGKSLTELMEKAAAHVAAAVTNEYKQYVAAMGASETPESRANFEKRPNAGGEEKARFIERIYELEESERGKLYRNMNTAIPEQIASTLMLMQGREDVAREEVDAILSQYGTNYAVARAVRDLASVKPSLSGYIVDVPGEEDAAIIEYVARECRHAVEGFGSDCEQNLLRSRTVTDDFVHNFEGFTTLWGMRLGTICEK